MAKIPIQEHQKPERKENGGAFKVLMGSGVKAWKKGR